MHRERSAESLRRASSGRWRCGEVAGQRVEPSVEHCVRWHRLEEHDLKDVAQPVRQLPSRSAVAPRRGGQAPWKAPLRPPGLRVRHPRRAGVPELSHRFWDNWRRLSSSRRRSAASRGSVSIAESGTRVGAALPTVSMARLRRVDLLDEELAVDAPRRPRSADRLMLRHARGDAPTKTSVRAPVRPSMIAAGDLPRPFPDTSRRVPSRSYVTGFVTAQWKTAGITRIPAVLLCEEGDLNTRKVA